MAVQPDGKVIAAGITQKEPGSSDQNFAVARYNTDGSLDATFGNQGKVRLLSYHGDAWTTAAVAGGKIVLGGFAYTPGWEATAAVPEGFNWYVARLNADGSPDNTFGGDGIVALSLAPGGYYDVLRDLLVLDDGSVVAVGDTFDATLGKTVAAVARFDSSGAVLGSRTYQFFAGGDSFLTGVARQPGSTDGGVFVAGHGFGNSSGGWDTVVARLDASGAFGAFGDKGIVRTDWNGAAGNDSAQDLAVQPDGKPVIAAQATAAAGQQRMAAARFTAAGLPDTSFDADVRGGHRVYG